MKYAIVASYYLDEFQDNVNEMLAAGWKLQGGVAVSTRTGPDETYNHYAQALYLPDPDENEK